MNEYLKELKNKIVSFIDAKSEIDNLNKVISELNKENARLKNKISHMEEELIEIIEKLKIYT